MAYQLTTMPIVITTDTDLTGADSVELVIRDTTGHRVYIDADSLTVTSTSVITSLTQDQTKQLKPGICWVQLRYKDGSDVPDPSNEMVFELRQTLSEEVL